jgi:hypothetical protein
MSPIGGQPPQPQQSSQSTPPSDEWSNLIAGIQIDMDTGEYKQALTAINTLISDLKAYQPQTPEIKAAIDDLTKASTLMQEHALPPPEVTSLLNDAWNNLS